MPDCQSNPKWPPVDNSNADVTERKVNSMQRVACIQNNASADVEENIRACTALIREAARQGAGLICTPEYFSGLRVEGARMIPASFPADRHPVIMAYSKLASELKVNLLLGSVGITAGDGKVFNRTIVLDPEGAIVAEYDKIHMFDVDLGDDKVYQESATIDPGQHARLAKVGGLTLGLSICYDLRFAHLYRRLAKAGANVLTVPAAFTHKTGEAHWHVLNRARAIENACYVIAPCQFGSIEGGGRNYGHSLIIDPWGVILADGGECEGVIVADIDVEKVASCRRRIPSLQNDREFFGPE